MSAPLPDPLPTGPAALLLGVRAVLDGLRRLASTPRLWPPLVAIALAHALLLTLAVWLGWSQGDDLVVRLVGAAPDSGLWSWLHTLGVVLARVALIAVLVVTSWIGAGILAGPLYDRLSATVEVLEGTLPEDDTGWSRILGDIAQGVLHSVYGLGLYGLAMACAAPVLLVPGVGELAWPVLSSSIAIVVLAREVLDYPSSRRRWTFRRKLALLRANPWLTLGVGGTTFVGLLIPLLNLVVMSSAVVGATRLFTAWADLLPADDAAGRGAAHPPAPT